MLWFHDLEVDGTLAITVDSPGCTKSKMVKATAKRLRSGRYIEPLGGMEYIEAILVINIILF